jgi:hypothetical protein
MSSSTASSIRTRVKSAFVGAGYKSEPSNRYSKKIANDTVFFVYPRIKMIDGVPHFDPMIGIDNLRLGERIGQLKLLKLLKLEDVNCRVAYMFLYQFEAVREQWNSRTYLAAGDVRSEEEAISLMLQNLEEHAIPFLIQYSGIENVTALMRNYIARKEDRRLVVMDAKEKLEMLAPN